QVVRLDPQRLLELDDGVVDPPAGGEQVGELRARRGIFGPPPHHLLERALGEDGAAGGEISADEEPARVRVIRGELDRLLDLLHRGVELLLGEERLRELVARLRVLGVEHGPALPIVEEHGPQSSSKSSSVSSMSSLAAASASPLFAARSSAVTRSVTR